MLERMAFGVKVWKSHEISQGGCSEVSRVFIISLNTSAMQGVYSVNFNISFDHESVTIIFRL